MKQFFPLIFLIATFTMSYAQESKQYQKLKQDLDFRPAYIINNDSVKIHGLIQDKGMTYEYQNYSAIIFAKEDGIKTTYNPSQIIGFGFSGYKYVSDGKSFYQILQKGKRVTLYKRKEMNHISTPGGHHSSVAEYLFVKRPDESVFKEVKKRKFKQEFINYFEDCDELVRKIQNGEYTHKDINEIVRKYNRCE